MKSNLLFFLTIFTTLSQNLQAQINPLWDELIVGNLHPEDTLVVRVSPMGFIFSGDKSYKPKSIHDTDYHNFGGIKKLFYMPSNFENKNFRLNHDVLSPNSCDSNIGYGKYKVHFSKWGWDTIYSEYTLFNIDSLIIDFSDADYGYSGIWSNFTNDFLVYYWSQDSIFVEFHGGTKIKLDTTDRDFQIWNQEGRGTFKSPNKTGFKSDLDYTVYPIYSTVYGSELHLNPGDLNLNLQIDHDISTRDTLIYPVTDITIKKKAALFISESKTFDMITPAFGYNNLIAEDSSALVLFNSAKIILHSPNKLTLKNKSRLTFHPNSELIIQPGAVICNEGANINSPGKIVFEKGVHTLCSDIVNDFFVKDSTKIILEDSAVVIVPNNYNIHLRGNTTSLIMKPGSKMKFGENSGIVCDSGAKVVANNAVFTSADSTKKWNGISLKHRSQDTIKNCIIKNADFGINIMNKNDNEGSEIPYSAEISGCSFINQTSHVLNNGIYAAGSSKLLISNNV